MPQIEEWNVEGAFPRNLYAREREDALVALESERTREELTVLDEFIGRRGRSRSTL